MSSPPEPLYLERQTYRRRRLQDAARFLPFFGAILLIFPALWSEGTSPASPGTAPRGLYIFAAWFLLIVGAALMARRLGPSAGEPGAAPWPGGGGKAD